MKSTAIIFLSHIINKETIERYENIKNNISGNHTLFWAYDGEQPKGYPEINWFSFNWNELTNTYGKGLYSEGHFKNIIYFLFPFIKKNKFDYYWIIEYDVLMTGNKWEELFQEMEKYDVSLISNNIEKYDINTLKYSSLTKGCENVAKYGSFNPIFRITLQGIKRMEKFYLANDCYYNYGMPTSVIKNKNDYYDLSLSRFMKQGCFYFSTVKDLKKEKQDGILLHPVKLS